MPRTGLLIVYTGDGRGKTTAALGQAVRAVGQGLAVSFIQFIKGAWPTGEAAACRRFGDRLEWHTMGSGFTWASAPDEARSAARQGWDLASATLAAGRHDLVVLDELTHAIKQGFVTEDEAVTALTARPAAMHVVVTGRDACDSLISIADLVTEMRCLKHPYAKGIAAQRGIEF